jgi:hypothetical protein
MSNQHESEIDTLSLSHTIQLNQVKVYQASQKMIHKSLQIH